MSKWWIGWPLAALMGCQDATPAAPPGDGAVGDLAAPVDAGPPTPDLTPDLATEGPDADPADAAPTPDAAPPRVPVVAPMHPATQRLFQGPVQGLAVLGEGAVLDTPRGVLWLDAAGTRALPTQGLGAAAEVDGVRLVADAEGALWAADGAGMARSPLGVEGVVDLAVEGDRLWISTAQGLHLWQAGALRPVTALAPAERPAHTLRAGRWGQASALWFISAEGVPGALVADGGEVRRWRMADAPTPAYALAVTTDATWALADAGLWRFDGQRWAAVPLGGRLATLAAWPTTPDLWLGLVDGTVWHSRAGRFRPLLGLAPAGVLRADAEGALWAAGAQGVERAVLGRLVDLEGPPPGARLTEPVTLAVRPSEPAAVEAVAWQLDGGPAVAVDGPPWALTVGPEVGPGPHTVTVTVTWAGGDTAEVVWPFEVPRPPTWVADIQPLFEAHCATSCHGDRGQARPLFQVQQWRAAIDPILDAVRQARMPLAADPLSPAAIDRIAAWQAAGMPEE
ncbi:MAG: hypothetical protein KC613_12520 [Myxococcales bacterium]|nr:hypothetical protein [Myxococcales bacterium]